MSKSNFPRPRVAVIVSHPIQHFCPMYASWAAHPEWQTKVFFASAMGYKPYKDSGFGESIAWKNLRIESFDHIFLNNGQVVPVNKNIDAPELEQELASYNPDVIVTYGYIQKMQQKALKWAKGKGKKIFYISDSERAHYEPKWRWLLKNIWYRPYFRQIDCCLTVGNYNEHYYGWMGVPMHKMVRLGFSIDRETYQLSYQQKEHYKLFIRSKYQIPDNHIIISVVGKLIQRKRQVELVQALQLLETISNVPFTALIVGSGPDHPLIEQLASMLKSNRAIVTGFIAPEDLVAYYAASDVYVHPSEHDPHTLAVGEAIYLGCPIVVSDRCGVYGPTDDVQIGRNGFVYPCGDIDALAKCIARLGENAALRLRFGRYSHEFALESQSRAHDTGLRAALSAVGLLD